MTRPDLRAALEGMVRQFAYYTNGCLHTGGLSALEEAFDALGWGDPHPAPEQQCDEPGCTEQRTCGGPGPGNTYRWTCGEHATWLHK